jgi:hypothetical protein
MLHLVGYILEYTYDARTHKVQSPNNTTKWQMEFNSAFKGLNAGGYLAYKQIPTFLSDE